MVTKKEAITLYIPKEYKLSKDDIATLKGIFKTEIANVLSKGGTDVDPPFAETNKPPGRPPVKPPGGAKKPYPGSKSSVPKPGAKKAGGASGKASRKTSKK